MVNDEQFQQTEEHIQYLPAKDVQVGMIVESDIFATNGALLIPRGSEITTSVLICLTKFAEGVGVEEPIKIRIMADIA